MDSHKILGISKNSTIDEIKKAFRKKALELHPDVNSSKDAGAKFIELNNAYKALTDPNFKLNIVRPQGRPSNPNRPNNPIKPVQRDIWGDPIEEPWKDSMTGKYYSDEIRVPNQILRRTDRRNNHLEPEVDLWKQMPKNPTINYWKEYERLKILMVYEDPELFWKKLDEWCEKNL